jgi:hypothetical protein
MHSRALYWLLALDKSNAFECRHLFVRIAVRCEGAMNKRCLDLEKKGKKEKQKSPSRGDVPEPVSFAIVAQPLSNRIIVSFSLFCGSRRWKS